MITLTEKQNDALKEVGNIGVSRAARQLSELTQKDISITVPNIFISTLDEVVTIFQLSLSVNYPSISVKMDGGLKGYTILLFDDGDGKRLCDLLKQKFPTISEEQSNVQILLEVGNIIISSSVGAIGNMLKHEVRLEVPEYNNGNILASLKVASEVESFAVLVISAALHVKEHNISSNLLLIFEMDEVPGLIGRIDEL